MGYARAMSDDAKRRILARRAQFIAASVALTVSGTALGADGSVDDGATDADIDADAGDDTAPPEPCLSIARPEPQACLCALAAPDAPGQIPSALIVVAGLAALRRRSRERR